MRLEKFAHLSGVGLGQVPADRVARAAVLALHAVHVRALAEVHLHAGRGAVERDVREVVLAEVLLRQGDVERLAGRLRCGHRRRRRSFDHLRHHGSRGGRGARCRHRGDVRRRGSGLLAGLPDEDEDDHETDRADERGEGLEAVPLRALVHVALQRHRARLGAGRSVAGRRRLVLLVLLAHADLALVGLLGIRVRRLRLGRGGVVVHGQGRDDHHISGDLHVRRRRTGRGRGRERRFRREIDRRRLCRARLGLHVRAAELAVRFGDVTLLCAQRAGLGHVGHLAEVVVDRRRRLRRDRSRACRGDFRRRHRVHGRGRRDDVAVVRAAGELRRERVLGLLLVVGLLHDLRILDGHAGAIRADADEIAILERQNLIFGEERAIETRLLAAEALAVLLDRVLAEALLVDAVLDLRDVGVIDDDLPGVLGLHVRADEEDSRRLVREVEDLGHDQVRARRHAEPSFDEILLTDGLTRQRHARRIVRRAVVDRSGDLFGGRRRRGGAAGLGRDGLGGRGEFHGSSYGRWG